MANSRVSESRELFEVRVRDATETDLPRIVELLSQLSLDRSREDLGPPLPEVYRQGFHAIAADPRQRLLVVETRDRVVGAVSLVIVPNLSYQGRPYAIVGHIVVDSTERGAGHGGLLLRAAIGEAQRAGCYKLSLTSNNRRKAAHRFYERLGFKATHKGYRLEL